MWFVLLLSLFRLHCALVVMMEKRKVMAESFALSVGGDGFPIFSLPQSA
jgi:hypothetical protein